MNKQARIAIAKHIVEFEARRDHQGRIIVYDLPAADGGGRYEVAGINSRYHPMEAAMLRNLIENGSPSAAEIRAAEYIANYTDAVAGWTSDIVIEAYLRDTCFNRGPGGAARVAQIAFGADVDGRVGSKTIAAIRAQEKKPESLLKLRDAREYYERHYRGRDETSQFWRGLVNRWNKAMTMAESFRT